MLTLNKQILAGFIFNSEHNSKSTKFYLCDVWAGNYVSNAKLIFYGGMKAYLFNFIV